MAFTLNQRKSKKLCKNRFKSSFLYESCQISYFQNRIFGVYRESKINSSVYIECSGTFNNLNERGLKMSTNINQKTDNKKEDVNQIHNKKTSTFVEVHISKNSLVQSHIDMELKKIIGNYFIFDNLEYQEVPDYSDSNKINKATLYAIKIITKQAALPFGAIINVKVEDTEPLFAEHEIESITLGIQKPIVLIFDNLAHYHFKNSEIINATAVHKVAIDIKEASEL